MVLDYKKIPTLHKKIRDPYFRDYSSNREQFRRDIELDNTKFAELEPKYNEEQSSETSHILSIDNASINIEKIFDFLSNLDTRIEDKVDIIDLKNKLIKERKSNRYENIQNKLLEIASKLRSSIDKNEKIRLIVDLNDFLKKNKKIIKAHFSDSLVFILNSL